MIKRKPYILFFVITFFLLIYTFVMKKDNISILNIKDTYYVVSNLDFYRIIIILFLFLGFLYIALERMKIVLFTIVSKIHVILTILLPFLFLYLDYKESLPIPEIANFGQIMCYGNDYNFYKFLLILALVLLQLLFIINIFVALIKKMKSFRASK